MTQNLSDWALPRLSRLLPLDDDSLKQIITYSDNLSKPAAAEHLKDLLGDSPQALEFISSFQSRRSTLPSEATPVSSTPGSRDVSESEVPRPSARPRKKKQPFNRLPPPREIQQQGEASKVYMKNSQDDYITGTGRNNKHPALSNALALQSQPDGLQLPAQQSHITSPARSPARPEASQPSRLPPSAAGTLISDTLHSNKASHSTSAAPTIGSKQSKTKINISGGPSMRGASTTLTDLDSAIRALEIQTNPTLTSNHPGTSSADETARRKCNCMAQRHLLLAAAPNCLSCGKIICLKEGLGPCTFCGAPLLNAADLHAMLRVLRDERGREKQAANNAAHKRPDVAQLPRPFTSSNSNSNPGSNPASRAATPTPADASTNAHDDDDDDMATLAAAKAHRDRLLAYQSHNAQRTTIHDEAADFSTPDDGTSLWLSPQERALQLKKQQAALRAQEWSARPEWEKKRVVVSLDVVGGKVVRRMGVAERERPVTPESGDGGDGGGMETAGVGAGGDGPGTEAGTFSRNPLLGGLIRPVFRPKGKGKEKETEEGMAGEGSSKTWRRVQDDNDDNEGWILDGGAYGEGKDGFRA